VLLAKDGGINQIDANTRFDTWELMGPVVQIALMDQRWKNVNLLRQVKLGAATWSRWLRPELVEKAYSHWRQDYGGLKLNQERRLK
jgi:hypothetical protein